jgi:hypothetical protein
MPRKIDSKKNANPSSENGMPITGPACSMNAGHKSPSSNDNTVPETAPTTNTMAVPLAHRRASSSHTGSPVRIHHPSAMTMSNGMPMPMVAKIMWKPSDTAICRRAASRSSTEFQRERPDVAPDLEDFFPELPLRLRVL